LFIPPTDSSTGTLCQLNSNHLKPSQKFQSLYYRA